MEHNNNQKKLANPPVFDIEKVAASNDCTGLIPAAVKSEDEAEIYADLLGIHEQKPSPKES